MVKIQDLELYVGTKEEYNIAISEKMKIVCALNRANGFVTHQSVVGWQGRGCNKDNPYYLYKLTDDAIYLNMVDAEDSKYINDEMIDPALGFIHRNLTDGEKVFVYCSLGESRSPSIALMYLLEHDHIRMNADILHDFKNEFYPRFNPRAGNSNYILNRWK